MKTWICINKVNQLLDIPCVEHVSAKKKSDISKSKYEILNRIPNRKKKIH